VPGGDTRGIEQAHRFHVAGHLVRALPGYCTGELVRDADETYEAGSRSKQSTAVKILTYKAITSSSRMPRTKPASGEYDEGYSNGNKLTKSGLFVLLFVCLVCERPLEWSGYGNTRPKLYDSLCSELKNINHAV
jgi:hypothetical protein